MNFVLMGFQQSQTIRQFAFERIGDDRSRTTVIVNADLALVRKYAIPIQELPLLCRRLLETADPAALAASLTFTENAMVTIRNAARDAAAEKKPHRAARPAPSNRLGQAWRAHQP